MQCEQWLCNNYDFPFFYVEKTCKLPLDPRVYMYIYIYTFDI